MSINEDGELSLGRGAENESCGKLRGLEDTINGNIDGLLGSKLSTAGDVDRQGGNDALLKSGDRALTPAQQRSLDGTSDVSLRVQPSLQLSTSRGVDSASAASKHTTLEGSGTTSTQAGEQRNVDGSTDVDTKNSIKNSIDLASNRAQDISNEAECTALVRDISWVSESRACQTGKQDEGRTHIVVPKYKVLTRVYGRAAGVEKKFCTEGLYKKTQEKKERADGSAAVHEVINDRLVKRFEEGKRRREKKKRRTADE